MQDGLWLLADLFLRADDNLYSLAVRGKRDDPELTAAWQRVTAITQKVANEVYNAEDQESPPVVLLRNVLQANTAYANVLQREHTEGIFLRKERREVLKKARKAALKLRNATRAALNR